MIRFVVIIVWKNKSIDSCDVMQLIVEEDLTQVNWQKSLLIELVHLRRKDAWK